MTRPACTALSGVILILSISASCLRDRADSGECTAGVACGRATTDGRPLLWKSRDTSDRNNEVVWNSSGKYKFIAVTNAGDKKNSWMGLNEKGFAIINTLSTDLGKNAAENGMLMARALATVRSVDEFEAYLKRTNPKGRKTAAIYGVIDAGGGAAFFETAAAQYWRFNAADTPDGYIVKTNFAVHGGGSGGVERYRRSEILMKDFFDSDRIDWKEICRIQARDFSDQSGTPLPVPFPGQYQGAKDGCIPTGYAICRNITVSFAAIQGVLQHESPALSTMWTILGQPATGITVPYWPVGPTPPEADGKKTAPLCDAANSLREKIYSDTSVQPPTGTSRTPIYLNSRMLRDDAGGGIWKTTLPVEESLVAEGEAALERWRKQSPPAAEILALERKLAMQALEALHQANVLLEKKTP